MKIWALFYAVIFSFNAVDGFYSLLPNRNDIQRVGWTEMLFSFLLIFLLIPLLISLLVWRLHSHHFEKPSWNNPVYKPLQITRTFVGLALCATIGAAFALPFTNSAGITNFYMDCVLLGATLLGERLVYWIHRDKIIDTKILSTSS